MKLVVGPQESKARYAHKITAISIHRATRGQVQLSPALLDTGDPCTGFCLMRDAVSHYLALARTTALGFLNVVKDC